MENIMLALRVLLIIVLTLLTVRASLSVKLIIENVSKNDSTNDYVFYSEQMLYGTFSLIYMVTVVNTIFAINCKRPKILIFLYVVSILNIIETVLIFE